MWKKEKYGSGLANVTYAINNPTVKKGKLDRILLSIYYSIHEGRSEGQTVMASIILEGVREHDTSIWHMMVVEFSFLDKAFINAIAEVFMKRYNTFRKLTLFVNKNLMSIIHIEDP